MEGREHRKGIVHYRAPSRTTTSRHPLSEGLLRETLLSRVGTNELEVPVSVTSPISRTTHAPQGPFLIAAAFAVLHLVLALVVDRADADLFIRADRAGERLNTVLEFLAASSWIDAKAFLATHGIIGDYAVHAALYGVGGRIGVVIVQVALTLASGLCVYRIGTLLGLTARTSAIAMGVYLCLPHTIVFPHQLATEALHIPLVVISTWLLIETLYRPRLAPLLVSALCLGLATLIRPIMLLWPFVTALALVLTTRPRAAMAYVGAALLPVLAWMTFIGVQTGEFGLGKSGHSMERNLYDRVGRITDTLPPAARVEARAAYLENENRELGATDYLRFWIDYPAASFKHLARDAMAFFGKSGIERVTLDYLALGSDTQQLQDPDRGWRRQLEERGAIETARSLSQTLGTVFFVSIIGAGLMLCLIALAIAGSLHFVKRWRALRDPRVAAGLLLASLVVYIFWFSQVINAMQSRHRAPAEFAIVLLAAIGWLAWRERRTRSTSAV